MKRKMSALMLFLVLSLSLTGCASADKTKAGPEQNKSQSSPVSSQISQTGTAAAAGEINLEESYDPMITFEYTKDMLYEMNEDNEDFEIETDNSGSIFISGRISRSPAANEKGVLEQLCMIRSVLGLVNPKQQLEFSPGRSSEDRCVFPQYHAGLRLYGSQVTVNIDADTRMIYNVNANITGTDVLAKIKNTPLMSEAEIIRKNEAEWPGLKTEELVLYNMKEYKSEPTPAYIAHGKDNVLIIRASDGKIIDLWSSIID